MLTRNGPGPYRIVNNYLEGSAENVMFGGADVAVPNQVPADIEVRHNYLTKPLSWKPDDPSFTGTAWPTKNLFELKYAQRVLIEGNVFEHSWVGAQVGFGLLLKTGNGLATQQTTDVTVRHNIISGVAGGINVAGIDGVIQRVTITNNLFQDVGSSTWGSGNGRLFQAINVADLQLSHNTGLAPEMALSLDQPTSPRLTMLDNIVARGNFGVKGPGVTEGGATLASFAPSYAFTNNLVIGADGGSYPSNNFFPATTGAVGFTNANSGDFSLASNSPYKGKASDSADPGINYLAILSATQNVKP